MQNPLIPFPEAFGKSKPNTFSIVILYEDFATGRRAKETYDYLAQHLGANCLFHNNMWKFDVLRLPKLKEMAAREAAEADMVIVSLRAETGLPPEIRGWTDLFLDFKGGHPCAMVALVEGADSGQKETAAVQYFREACRKGGMDYFVQAHDSAKRQESIDLVPRPTDLFGSTYQGVPVSQACRWETAD